MGYVLYYVNMYGQRTNVAVTIVEDTAKEWVKTKTNQNEIPLMQFEYEKLPEL